MMGYLLLLLVSFDIKGLHAEEPKDLCFDFSKKTTLLLREAPARFALPDQEPKELGTLSSQKFEWAKVNGIVAKPISAIYQKLLDPMITRNRKTTQVETKELPTPGLLKRVHVDVTVKPVFFITLRWEEEWAYTLLEGTAESPKSILISYQKTNGTSHIRHFCGNILLKKLDANSTGVFLTEDIDADHRSADDVYNGILGTLRILRE